ncbi:MAG TPA: hypothetical protein DIS90_02095 [Cytophagales bacterium]|nr:hypothetical protein [Cytophagales bacterium]
MKYNQYNAEEFLNDESFQSFALGHKEEDVSFWTAWIKEHPEKIVEVNEAIKILTAFSIRTINPEKEKFESDLQQLHKALNEQKELTKTIPIRSFRFSWKIAASIVLLIGVSIAAYQYVTYFTSKAEQVVVEKSVPGGKKLTFMLPDGSKVKLNGNSYLKYDQNYLLKQRSVTLIGEAYFEVVKDSINPFTVVSGAISTTALGTSFNVKAYDNENLIEVALITGKVKVVDNRDNSLTLNPGKGARYLVDGQQLIAYEFNSDEVLAWKDGIIKFKNASIDEVSRTLERWYGVSIEIINPPDQAWRINGTFENESLENVLNSISYTSPLNYTLQNNKLTLEF